MSLQFFKCGIIAALIGLGTVTSAQSVKLTTIGNDGWASNSVNTVIFRKNSLITFKDTQYAAYYDNTQYVVLAKRMIGSDHWTTKRTPYQGDATDAHKSISIMVDGAGYLHMVWGQHNNKLNYVRSTTPGSLTLTEKLSMTGLKEGRLSYPEFYRLHNGNLLFFYRDGGSGNGSLLINYYDCAKQRWTQLQDNLIDGEGKRSAYWQVTTDVKGTIHISWVWRETPDVASNHDIAYACSTDGGKTWQKSNGQKYTLPITAANAEYAVRIPQNSDLINQTSMFADAQGRPYIATYWRGSNQTAPQYHIVYYTGKNWATSSLNFHKTPFSLSGGGTKSIPLSRPQIVAWKNGKITDAALIFRDEELDNRVTAAITPDIDKGNWQLKTLANQPVGEWEPTFDTELWKERQTLNLFIEKVTQVDGEGNTKSAPQAVQVLEWKPIITK